MLEADSEEDVAVSVSPADALRRVVRVDLQLKHAGRENLRHQTSIVFNRRVEFKSIMEKKIDSKTEKETQKSTYHINQGQRQKASREQMCHFFTVFFPPQL